MRDAFDKRLVESYGSIIDEIKSRLRFVDWVLHLDLPAPSLHIAISDLCCLQFRKIFEGIALGCLIAQSEHPEASGRLRKMYRADLLVDALERLDPHFYPHPCKVERKASGAPKVRPAIDGHWLTKANLKKLYFAMDDALHVGALTKRKDRAEPYERDSLILIRDLIVWLLEHHTITLYGGRRRLVVETNLEGGNALITFQTKRS